jgi:uncharacterized protein YbjT (DUF2867 family)
MDVAVIGATGFVGSHLVPVLEERRHRVRAVSRSGRRLAGWGPEIVPLAANVETGDGLESAVLGADAVVHLVAIPRERAGRTFEAVNVTGTERLLAAARAGGVQRVVHLSALGVTPDPSLRFLSSKCRAEELLRAGGLDWVILRPSLLFGPGDGFFSLIRETLRWWSPGIVAIPGDGQTRFQPLAADDLAHAIERCVSEPGRSASVYELGGPEYLTYRQIVRAVMEATGRRRLMVNVPVPLLRALAAVTDRVLPVFPVTHDQIGSLGRPNWTDIDAYQSAFGRRPRPLDLSYLGRSG